MLGIRLKSTPKSPSEQDSATAKLFFDAFSKRLGDVERATSLIHSDIDKLKASRDSSQVSDLVLLERLQKVEAVVQESLSSIKRIVEAAYSERSTHIVTAPREASAEVPIQMSEAPISPIVLRSTAPRTAEPGSLSSITTPTELTVLSLLAEKGPMSAPEIGRSVGRSREHSARLMKKLFDEGYVRRDQNRIPFRYAIVDRVRQSFKTTEPKAEPRETVAVPQS